MITGVRLLILLLALALTGAPFGMGRMMDDARQTGAVMAQHHMHQPAMSHGDEPTHDPSKPHYMACSACVALPQESVGIALNIEPEKAAPLIRVETLHDKTRLPVLRPPRA